MKINLILILTLLSLVSCSNETDNNKENNSADSTKISKIEKKPDIEMISDKNINAPFFIISIKAFTDVESAIKSVKKLKLKHEKTGYLWMPDYKSLSGKEEYVSFIGPFDFMNDCIKYLAKYKKENSKAYAVKVEHSKDRTTIFNSFDIRINNVKQKLVLTYSTPEDEKEYAESGGEDWGWFTNDVHTYFRKHYTNKVITNSLYSSWFSKQEIKNLANNMQLEGFGYILIDPMMNKKTFLQHDMSDIIISNTCDFFGLEKK